VLRREKEKPSFTATGLSTRQNDVQPRWLRLRESLKNAPLMEKMRKVTAFFNQWPYKTDNLLWGVDDYWETPSEFINKSGDCEDYAIVKYFAMRSLGVPAERLRVAAIKNAITGNGHAVLVVITDDNAFVMDNVTNAVVSHTRLGHYRPVYSVNEEYMWRHVRPARNTAKR
jgi:predicted transglutaminase-like cysteine proteinase